MNVQPGDVRLLPSAIILWCITITAVYLNLTWAAAVVVGASALGIGGAAVMAHVRPHSEALRGFGMHALLCAVLVGASTPGLLSHESTRDQLRDAAEQGVIVELTAVLLAEPSPPRSAAEWNTASVQAIARTTAGQARIGRNLTELPGSVRLLMTDPTGDRLGEHSRGSTVRVRGTITLHENLLIVRASSASELPPPPWLRAPTTARQQLRDGGVRVTSHLPVDEAALVRGMTYGDTTGLSDATEDAMRRAGLTHLVAVSGGNLAVVLATVLIPALLFGVRRRTRIGCAFVLMVAYVWLVGEEPSVQRAATMATPLLVARFIGVRASPVACVAFAVIVWCLVDPANAASIGFMLSALTVLGILLGSAPVAAGIRRVSAERIPMSAALVVAVPMVAQLVCTPILVLLSPEISLWAVLANMLAAPLVGPITILGLVMLPLSVLWSPAAQVCASVAGGGAHLIGAIATVTDGLPGSRIPVPEGWVGVGVAGAGAVAVIVLIVAGDRARMRFAAVCVVVALSAPHAAHLVPGRFGSGQQWNIAMCAVGQGDSFVVRSGSGPASATILIDTGPDPEALRACFQRIGVEKIDLLILTHPHADHVGGVEALTGRWMPKQQWICPISEARSAIASGPPAIPVTRGDSWQHGGLSVEVLWPPSAEAAIAAAAREDSSDPTDAANDCSVATAITIDGDTRLLTLGDLEPVAQRELLALGVGSANAMTVAHHGSRRQHAELYETVQPELALVSAGVGNSFGHPAAQTVSMLEDLDAHVICTCEHGTVVLNSRDLTQARSVDKPR